MKNSFTIIDMSNVELESKFEFAELFFSRTDSRGIIKSCNSVFQRVSEYNSDDILEKPHSLIRHKDMPRGVFHLFWDTLKTGKPIGAYVKNKSRSGKYYWVFAVASPVDGGYVSIRLKPSGAIFSKVPGLYAELCELEAKSNLTPQQSHEKLLERLKQIGFANYQSFMVAALNECMAERNKALKLDPPENLNLLNQVLELTSKVSDLTEGIVERYRGSELVPLNLNILSDKIGQQAAPIAVVATMYESMAKEIREQISIFKECSIVVRNAVEVVQFTICTQQLQSEMLQYFTNQKNLGPIQAQREMEYLNKLETSCRLSARKDLDAIAAEFNRFSKNCTDLKAISTGLDIVRVTGRIEVTVLDKQTTQLQGLIGQLSEFKQYLAENLSEIEKIRSNLNQVSSRLHFNLSA